MKNTRFSIIICIAGIILFGVTGAYAQETGACCTPDFTCIDDINVEDCESLGGIYQGDGSNCATVTCTAPTGACCTPELTCIDDINAVDCESSGGIYQGDGSNCATVTCTAPTGACCTPELTCIDDVTNAYCQSQGGSYQGDGSNCATVTCDVCDCRPGDANDDGVANVGDVVYIIAYVFKGGPAPQPYELCSGDPNADCGGGVGDAVYLIGYVFKGGPPPCSCEDWVTACGMPIH